MAALRSVLWWSCLEIVEGLPRARSADLANVMVEVDGCISSADEVAKVYCAARSMDE